MIDDGRPSLLSAHRPSVLLATGGDLRCDPTRSPAEEAQNRKFLERALSERGENHSAVCIFRQCDLLKKTACSPRHFLHNKSSHGAPVRPAPVSIAFKNSPSKDRPIDFFTFASAGREET